MRGEEKKSISPFACISCIPEPYLDASDTARRCSVIAGLLSGKDEYQTEYFDAWKREGKGGERIQSALFEKEKKTSALRLHFRRDRSLSRSISTKRLPKFSRARASPVSVGCLPFPFCRDCSRTMIAPRTRWFSALTRGKRGRKREH